MKCESIDYKVNKTWSVIKRESNEFDAGVGLNKYKFFKDLKCNILLEQNANTVLNILKMQTIP